MICTTCGLDKDISDFYIDKKGYRRKQCKQCIIAKSCENQKKHAEHRKKYCHEYHQKNRSKCKEKQMQYRNMVDALKKPCAKCGEKRLYVLDFHHINPATKSFNINRKSAKSNFRIIEAEVDKCVCLCRNCHMEFHFLYGMNPKEPYKDLQDYIGKEVEK